MLDPTRYRLGVTIIDHQHSKLLMLVDQLERGGVDLQLLLEGFAEYADSHFLMEEELMEAHDYPLPKRRAHIAAHDAYRTRFQGLKAEALSGSPSLMKAMQAFLKTWWSEHIGGVDRELTLYLRTRGMHDPA